MLLVQREVIWLHVPELPGFKVGFFFFLDGRGQDIKLGTWVSFF